eukprot:CAMPEP_0118725612 /NCGR_PEP_ID=MMETSP0800-20121206/33236_1 /TAXON_ID=210618 ORGANISM="Striatella unipunctata, Strain CCMP2910" /NCGR_SAMPLE_ID=MMETSP0800 /ASSEMBLY_ACC=CAM_ASM_000638 /LENGTH=105 /DNA_ID=CAMNT_0006634329 /DNA_START=123 /DNA_END=436 /DNA_ORIENTATION=-
MTPNILMVEESSFPKPSVDGREEGRPPNDGLKSTSGRFISSNPSWLLIFLVGTSICQLGLLDMGLPVCISGQAILQWCPNRRESSSIRIDGALKMEHATTTVVVV